MATLLQQSTGLAKSLSSRTEVPSFTDPSKSYEVKDIFTPFARCSCPDFRYRGDHTDGHICKHIVWARRAVEQLVRLQREWREEIIDPLASSVVDLTHDDDDHTNGKDARGSGDHRVPPRDQGGREVRPPGPVRARRSPRVPDRSAGASANGDASVVAGNGDPKGVGRGEVVPFDASVFQAGTYGSEGLCTWGANCNKSPAEYMTRQAGRSGLIFIALCHRHAVDRIGEDNLPKGTADVSSPGPAAVPR